MRVRFVRARSPLYSMPHLSLAMTGLPVKSFKNGFGLTGTIRRGAGSTRRSCGVRARSDERRARRELSLRDRAGRGRGPSRVASRKCTEYDKSADSCCDSPEAAVE
jgi:hypothetical protein